MAVWWEVPGSAGTTSTQSPHSQNGHPVPTAWAGEPGSGRWWEVPWCLWLTGRDNSVSDGKWPVNHPCTVTQFSGSSVAIPPAFCPGRAAVSTSATVNTTVTSVIVGAGLGVSGDVGPWARPGSDSKSGAEKSLLAATDVHRWAEPSCKRVSCPSQKVCKLRPGRYVEEHHWDKPGLGQRAGALPLLDAGFLGLGAGLG